MRKYFLNSSFWVTTGKIYLTIQGRACHLSDKNLIQIFSERCRCSTQITLISLYILTLYILPDKCLIWYIKCLMSPFPLSTKFYNHKTILSIVVVSCTAQILGKNHVVSLFKPLKTSRQRYSKLSCCIRCAWSLWE